MQYKISWLNEAVEELGEIRRYIETEEQEPEAAVAVVSRIYEAADSLSSMPERFPKDPERPKFRRYAVISSYSIFYQIKGTRVYIAHIWNNARNLKNLE